MNKESIYQIIGYQGVYSDSVKRALRKLLKENHPDRHGNSEIFKLVNEVKKELETNQVSFTYQKKDNIKKYDDIDYDYCIKMVNKLESEKERIIITINEKKDCLNKISQEYKNIYQKSLDEASKLLNNDNRALHQIKNLSYCMIGVLIILFLIAIITKNLIVFIVFGMMCLITTFIIEKSFLSFQKIANKSKIKIQEYTKTMQEIEKVIEKKSDISLNIVELERNLKKVENDLRFYNNLLK